MKITRKYLESIIKEEVEEVVRTVSADYLDLESTVDEQILSHSGPGSKVAAHKAPPEDPVLLLAFDIAEGKKDDELDNLYAKYNCKDTAMGGNADEVMNKLCPVIKRRKATINRASASKNEQTEPLRPDNMSGGDIRLSSGPRPQATMRKELGLIFTEISNKLDQILEKVGKLSKP